MELLIQNNFKQYIIVRLPQVIGKSNNNSTLINFLVNSIKNNIKIQLYNNATRYFIETEDLVLIFKNLIKNKNNYNKIHDIAIPIKYTIFEIVSTLEKILNINSDFEIVNGGVDYNLKLSTVENILQNLNLVYNKSYLEKSILKSLL
jgi:nucleoside-diphosphate-sugar epimerase